MSGLACAKVIIDNGAGAAQSSISGAATVERALKCMTNSVLLGATQGAYPTEAMEDEFIAAVESYKKAVSAATEPLLQLAGKIGKHCLPEG